MTTVRRLADGAEFEAVELPDAPAHERDRTAAQRVRQERRELAAVAAAALRQRARAVEKGYVEPHAPTRKIPNPLAPKRYTGREVVLIGVLIGVCLCLVLCTILALWLGAHQALPQ